MPTDQQKANRPRLLATMSGETVVFLLLLLSIALAGFNSGNNLLYLVAGVMLASIFVSIVAGRVNLSNIKVRRQLPNYTFSGRPFKVVLEVFNNKRHFNSFGVKLEAAAGEDKDVFFLSIDRNGMRREEAEVTLTRRGLHKFDRITLSSRFPWGLFELRKKVTDRHEIIVYPAIREIDRVINGSSHIRDEFPQFTKGPGSGLYGIREYRHGEDKSNISWKISAKLDKLIVKETESEEKRRVCVVFDNELADDSEAALEAFERAVSSAASIVWHLARNGYSVKLITRDKIIGYGIGPDHIHRMLIALAMVGPAKSGVEGLFTNKNMFEGGTGVLVYCADGSSAPLRASDFAFVLSEKVRAEAA